MAQILAINPDYVAPVPENATDVAAIERRWVLTCRVMASGQKNTAKVRCSLMVVLPPSKHITDKTPPTTAEPARKEPQGNRRAVYHPPRPMPPPRQLGHHRRLFVQCKFHYSFPPLLIPTWMGNYLPRFPVQSMLT